MDADGWIALAAAGAAYGHIVWAIYTSRRADRSDLRVTVREEPAVVASGSYVLTVVVTNHGSRVEHIERIGLSFTDATGVFPPDWGMNEQGTWKDIDVEIAPRANYRWSYDFASTRFRHGLGYQPWVQLATGPRVDGDEGIVSARGLTVVGLGNWTQPIEPSDDD